MNAKAFEPDFGIIWPRQIFQHKSTSALRTLKKERKNRSVLGRTETNSAAVLRVTGNNSILEEKVSKLIKLFHPEVVLRAVATA